MRVLTLGRDSSNDVQFADDRYVTRNCHCQLIQEDDGTYAVVDFSANGTFVNNNRIPRGVPVKLEEYDILQIGSSDALSWKSYFKVKTEFLKDSEPKIKMEPVPEIKAEPVPEIKADVVDKELRTTPSLPSKSPQLKERHGCVTFYLWLMIIGGVIGAINYFVQPDIIASQLMPYTERYFDPGIIYIFGVLSLINVGFAVALLQWKKWGFWAFCVSAVVALIINLYIGLNPVVIILGIIGILILWAILQIKKNGVKFWNNLE